MSQVACDQLVIERLGLCRTAKCARIAKANPRGGRDRRPPADALVVGASANNHAGLLSETRTSCSSPNRITHSKALKCTWRSRGGNATYHGPGQLVGYPIIPVQSKVADYLRQLEAILLEVIATFGVRRTRQSRLRGYHGGYTKRHDGQVGRDRHCRAKARRVSWLRSQC